MSKPIKTVALACAVLLLVSVVVLFVLAGLGPDIDVYAGRQIPKKFMTTIRSLDLLGEDEQIRFFYSDALYDINTGLYFVTKENLVLYCSEWEEPETIIPLGQIASLNAEYDESFLNDTMVFVTSLSGVEVTFPLSSGKGLDKKFVAAIKEGMTINQGMAGN